GRECQASSFPLKIEMFAAQCSVHRDNWEHRAELEIFRLSQQMSSGPARKSHFQKVRPSDIAVLTNLRRLLPSSRADAAPTQPAREIKDLPPRLNAMKNGPKPSWRDDAYKLWYDENRCIWQQTAQMPWGIASHLGEVA